MGVKLHRKSIIINNISLFIVLSLLFLHTISAMGKGISAFSWYEFIETIRTHYLTIAAGAITFLLVRSAKTISRYVFPIYALIILFNCFSVFFVSFDKVILTLNFAYLIFGFYFYSLWVVELSEAVYCPGYYIEDVGRKSTYDIRVKLILPNEDEGWGYLTQIGEASCFLLVEEKFRQARGKLKIALEYEGTSFEQFGEIITSYGGGLGIKFLHDTSDMPNIHCWNDFYTVICHRGLLPEYFEGLS